MLLPENPDAAVGELSSTAENHEDDESSVATEEAPRADTGTRKPRAEDVDVDVVHARILTNRHDVASSKSAVPGVPRNIVFLLSICRHNKNNNSLYIFCCVFFVQEYKKTDTTNISKVTIYVHYQILVTTDSTCCDLPKIFKNNEVWMTYNPRCTSLFFVVESKSYRIGQKYNNARNARLRSFKSLLYYSIFLKPSDESFSLQSLYYMYLLIILIVHTHPIPHG
jgi:hypothetical protein